MSTSADVAIVGAGILGLTTARALLARDPRRRIVVLDKEDTPAHHQTGRNSGVIHSGIYYRPDSGKAAMVAAGRDDLLAFLEQHGITYDMCGKVVVAVSPDEVGRLDALEVRAAENHVATERLDRAALREREPHIEGVAALLVPSAGIVDYAAVCDALVAELAAAGVEIRLGTAVRGAVADSNGVTVTTDGGSLTVGSIVNCGGLHCDRVAVAAGADTEGVRVMPFRGEYYELAPHARGLVNHLVYPLPDPDFPFLGVHLTRMIDGSIHAGPNAVPALAREGYRWRDISPRDTAEIAFARRTWVLARRYWRKEVGEIHRSLSRRAFLKALRRLCPDLSAGDLEPSASGVRAQAIAPDGTLLDDFAFAESPRAVHVMNAPSPAATASFAIAETVADRHERVLSPG
ncbi:MAG: L-2-hydroxyglutarate oxidase [Acidimicrobiales bacterium]|nr:L-2-hydroxyglutarate oxidase [Acidimicrobiales bacterium]